MGKSEDARFKTLCDKLEADGQSHIVDLLKKDRMGKTVANLKFSKIIVLEGFEQLDRIKRTFNIAEKMANDEELTEETRMSAIKEMNSSSAAFTELLRRVMGNREDPKPAEKSDEAENAPPQFSLNEPPAQEIGKIEAMPKVAKPLLDAS